MRAIGLALLTALTLAGSTEARTLNGRTPDDRLHSTARRWVMNFRQHKEKLPKNLKVRKEYERLGPEFQLARV